VNKLVRVLLLKNRYIEAEAYAKSISGLWDLYPLYKEDHLLEVYGRAETPWPIALLDYSKSPTPNEFDFEEWKREGMNPHSFLL